MLIDGKCLIRNPIVVFREDFEDNAVLFDPASDIPFALNQTGTFVWKNMDEIPTLGEMIQQLKENCYSAPENIEEDVLSFIKMLLSNELAGYTV
jgi:hypothetical protein